ncbi:uncharacterized protein y4wM (plasmid) [Arthrobacter sp. Hiyo8]|nr:uncharacterized protein y4wM [Arthrobacter sp. Hiyo8]
MAAAMVGCVLATAACTGTTSSATNTAGGTLKVTAGASGPFTDNFNALIASSSSASGFAAYAIFEPLLQEDFGSGKTRPWLVSSYTWGPDGKTLTLKTKEGVKWSDGETFTAKDVAFTFNLMKANPAFNAVSLPLTGAEATDNTAAVIHFSKPAYQVMWWRTETVPEHIWKDVQDPVKYANPNPVGTGPYMLKSFTPQAITLQKNPYYWQAGGNFSTVQYLAADSSSSMIANLQSGGVDWIGTAGIDGATVKKLAPNTIDYWNTTINPSVALLLPNFAHAPLDQLPVRKAIDIALDRDEISKIGTAGLNAAVESPTGMDVKTRGDMIAASYSDQKYGKADPDTAKKILTAAGYQLGPDNVFVSPNGQRLDFKLTVPTTYPQADLFGMTRVMVPELAAAGIKVTVKSEQQQAYVKDVEMGNYELTMRTNGERPRCTTSITGSSTNSRSAPPPERGPSSTTSGTRTPTHPLCLARMQRRHRAASRSRAPSGRSRRSWSRTCPGCHWCSPAVPECGGPIGQLAGRRRRTRTPPRCRAASTPSWSF